MKPRIERHSVLIYFALVFVISCGGVFLVLGPGRFPPSAEDILGLGASVYAATLAGPFLAGMVMAGLVDGMTGLREIVTRLCRWRVGARWYALALLPALGMAATALLLPLANADLRPAIIDSTDRAAIVVSALGPAILVALLEETGWTGFAVPRLRAHHSILTTGLLVGIVWGAWHFPLFWEGDSFAAALPLAILVTRLFSWLPPLRMLMVWTHDRTQSLLVVILMHAATTFVAITLSPATLSGARLLTSVLATAATMWILAVAVGAVNRWQRNS